MPAWPAEEELLLGGSQSPVSYEEDFEELSSNADLYVFRWFKVIEELTLIPEIMMNPYSYSLQ